MLVEAVVRPKWFGSGGNGGGVIAQPLGTVLADKYRGGGGGGQEAGLTKGIWRKRRLWCCSNKIVDCGKLY